MKIKGIDVSKTVKVYRNLKHGKSARPLYSVMQGGRVVARLHRVLLGNATFKVNEAGRQRVLKEERKNVHAFVIGRIANDKYTPKGKICGACGIDENGRDLPWKIRYNPYVAGHFVGQQGEEVKGAMCVLLNERGITAAYTY